jgi:hypothetical protein
LDSSVKASSSALLEEESTSQDFDDSVVDNCSGGNVDESKCEIFSDQSSELESDDEAVTSETARQTSVLLSLASALRYRLLSQLMLAFHLKLRERRVPAITISHENSSSPNSSANNSSPDNNPNFCSATPTSSRLVSDEHGSTNSSSSRGTPRKRDEADEEDDERDQKKPRKDPPNATPTPTIRRRFYCPYRKRDPGTFGAKMGDVCAGAWPDIAKLK